MIWLYGGLYQPGSCGDGGSEWQAASSLVRSERCESVSSLAGSILSDRDGRATWRDFQTFDTSQCQKSQGRKSSEIAWARLLGPQSHQTLLA
jgi:hypothetical protein